MSLRIEQEGIEPMAHRQVADIVGDHAIEPAHAVAPRDRDLGSPAQIVNTRAGEQRVEFGTDVAKISGRGRSRVLAQMGGGRSQFVMQRGGSHSSTFDYSEADAAVEARRVRSLATIWLLTGFRVFLFVAAL